MYVPCFRKWLEWYLPQTDDIFTISVMFSTSFCLTLLLLRCLRLEPTYLATTSVFNMPRKAAATPKATRGAAAQSETAVLKELVLAMTASNTQIVNRMDRMEAERNRDPPSTSTKEAPAAKSTRGRKKQQPPQAATTAPTLPDRGMQDIADAVREEVSTRYTRAPHQPPPTFVESTSEEEDEQLEQPPRRHKKQDKTSKFTHWPNDHIYNCSGNKVEYEDLAMEQFFGGFLAATRISEPALKDHMYNHLEILTEDIASFNFKSVHSFHKIWLQEIEQGRVAWGDDTRRDMLRRKFIWNPAINRARPTQQFASARGATRTLAPVVPLTASTNPCSAYNAGTCSFAVTHQGHDHICSFCATTFQRQSMHAATNCIKKKRGVQAKKTKIF